VLIKNIGRQEDFLNIVDRE